MTMIDLHAHICSRAPKNIPIERIVTEYFDSDFNTIKSLAKCRKRHLVLMRQLSMYFTCKYYGKDGISKRIQSLSEIGKEIGNKDHATVLHAKKAINNILDTDAKLREKINTLENHILQVKMFEFYSYLNNKRHSTAVTADGLEVTLLDFDFKDTRKWRCRIIESAYIVYRADSRLFNSINN